MKKILITTSKSIREFTDFLEAKAYKMCLVNSKVRFDEHELDTDQDVGLRGIEGARYSEKIKGVFV